MPLHELHHYVLRVKIILAGFNLAVSTSAAKVPVILYVVLNHYSDVTVYMLK